VFKVKYSLPTCLCQLTISPVDRFGPLVRSSTELTSHFLGVY